MTLKKSSRARLLSLAFGILLGLFLSIAVYDASYAQTPAPAPAAPAAAPAPAAPLPACDASAKPPILSKCKTDSGDTAWMLTSMALVLMMTIPGLALFYGGMVRKKNVLATVMQSFAITCLVTVLWMVIGYSWAFTDGGRLSSAATRRLLLMGMGVDVVSPLAADNPRVGLHGLPDDLRHHHPGADLRRVCRPHEVLGDDVVHGSVVAVRLLADRPLGLGRRLARRPRRARLRRRHRGAYQRRRRRSGAARWCSASARASAPTTWRRTTWCSP